MPGGAGSQHPPSFWKPKQRVRDKMNDFRSSRRAILRTSAWAVPAVTVATSAPAFATSAEPEPLDCEVIGWYKDPGEGQATKDYYVQVSCGNAQVTSVQIKDDVADRWVTAIKQSDGFWAAFGFNDSRRHRMVLVNGTSLHTVAFSPAR